MTRVFRGWERDDVGEERGGAVLLGDDRLLDRDRPGDRHRGVVEPQRRVDVRRVEVVVDQVGVGHVVVERLVAVADAARDEDRGGRVDLEVEGPPVAVALAEVDPRAEDPAGDHRDQLVPRLDVDAAGGAALGVEREVVLHRLEVGQPEPDHLLPLPVLPEPAAVVLVQVEPQHQQARDRGGLQVHYWPFAAYAASVASLCGRHQSSCSRYHSMVRASPASNSG